MTKVIGFFGGPGVGKSSAATGLFSKMKYAGYNCEYVSEYAKDVTWEDIPALLKNQVHVFSEQFRRQWRLLNKVDYIITDSPLLLSSVYYAMGVKRQNGFHEFAPSYHKLAIEFFDQTFDQFDNMNFYIKRTKPYVQLGRSQTEDEAIEVDRLVYQKMLDRGDVFVNTTSYEAIDDAYMMVT